MTPRPAPSDSSSQPPRAGRGCHRRQATGGACPAASTRRPAVGGAAWWRSGARREAGGRSRGTSPPRGASRRSASRAGRRRWATPPPLPTPPRRAASARREQMRSRKRKHAHRLRPGDRRRGERHPEPTGTLVPDAGESARQGPEAERFREEHAAVARGTPLLEDQSAARAAAGGQKRQFTVTMKCDERIVGKAPSRVGSVQSQMAVGREFDVASRGVGAGHGEASAGCGPSFSKSRSTSRSTALSTAGESPSPISYRSPSMRYAVTLSGYSSLSSQCPKAIA